MKLLNFSNNNRIPLLNLGSWNAKTTNLFEAGDMSAQLDCRLFNYPLNRGINTNVIQPHKECINRAMDTPSVLFLPTRWDTENTPTQQP